MGPIVLIVIILLLFVAALWYVPKARKQLKEERERRLRVAQGIHDEDEPEDKKKKKRKKRRRSWLSTAVDLPTHLEKQLLTVVPEMADMALKEHHAAKEAADELEALLMKYSRVRQEYLNTAALTAAVKTADNLDGWLARCVELLRQTRHERRKCLRKYEEFRSHNRKLQKALDELKRWFELLNPPKIKYDLENLEPEVQLNLELATLVLNEIGPVNKNFEDMPKKLQDGAEESDDQLEDLVHQAFEAASETIALVVEAAVEKQSLEDSTSNFKTIKRDQVLVEPEKPNDEEVKAFMDDALEWAVSIQEAELKVGSEVAKLTLAYEKATRSAEALTALASLIEDRTTGGKAVEEVASLDLDEGEESLPRWQRRRARPVRKPVTPPMMLTEEQECRRLVVKMVINLGSTAGFKERLNSSPKPVELSDSGLTGTERQQSEELTTLMRKLGFAIAQLRNVRDKLEETKAVSFEALTQADLEATDAERFIQQHARWLKESARRERDRETHGSRLDTLKTQQSERLTQLKEAAATLGRVVSEHLASKEAYPCSPELDVARRASQIVSEHFKTGLKKDKEEAEEEARKAEAKRKKAREKEEERRRKRRRSRW